MATIPTAPPAQPFTNPYLAPNPSPIFDPAPAPPAAPAPLPEPPDFYRNLVDEVPKALLGTIANQIIVWQRDDESSRSKWLKAWSDAAEYLGLTSGDRDVPWENASGVYDPLMLECMTRFQAEAVDSVFATGGPAKADVFGDLTDEKQAAALRVADHMNYVLSEEMQDFRQEKEQLFWGMGFAGVGFSKVVKNPVTQVPQSNYVRANMLFVPIGYSTLRKSPRIIEYMPVTLADVQRAKASGFYAASFEPQTGRRQYDQAEKADQRSSGLEAPIGDDTDVELLEAHVEFTIDPEPGYQRVGFPLPYVITIDKRGEGVASIRRNWLEGDQEYKRRETYIEYVFIPTDRFGIYGIGLAHIMGNLARAATGLLRGMLDAATLNNMRGGFRSNSLRISGDDLRVAPGEWKAVDCDIEDLAKAFFAPPYLPPDQTLLELLGTLDTRGRRLAGNADIQVADIGAQTPVGTTLAVIERGMKVFNSIQGRIAASLKRELKLIADINLQNLKASPIYNGKPIGQPGPRVVSIKNRTFSVSADDYDNATVVPAVDPDSGTVSQRILQTTALTTIAQQMPGPFNIKALLRNNAMALGVRNTDDILPPDELVPQLDPVTENARLIVGQPVQAYKGQDHMAHLQTHQAIMQSQELQQQMASDPQAQTKLAAGMAHQAEHMAFMQREQIEKILGFPLPDQMSPQLEAQLAPQIAIAATQAAQNPPQPYGGPPPGQPPPPDPIAQQNMIENQLQAAKLQQEGRLKEAELAQKDKEFQLKNATENRRIDLTHQAAMEKAKQPPGSAPPGPAGPNY